MFCILYILCISLSLAKAGIMGRASCVTVDSENGQCINITDCPPIYDVMYTMPMPFTKTVVDYVKRSYCGRVGKYPKVCCPFILSERGTYRDLSRHENVHLLTKNTCGRSVKLRIAGGTEAQINEFPWMALLVYATGFLCGGSVINERYVLTAAHCIDKGLRRVRIGEHTISSATDCNLFTDGIYCSAPYQELDIENTITHEMYSTQRLINDVALIRVARPIDFTVANAMPICLPIYENLRNSDFSGKEMTVAGWGFTDKDKQSDVLLQVGVKVISNKECKARYKKKRSQGYIVAEKMCAGTVGQDSCKGDSGGPLMYMGMYNNSLSYIQQGIVSYGPSICGSGIPGVYVRVAKFAKWILDHIKP